MVYLKNFLPSQTTQITLLLFAARQGGHYKLPGDLHRTCWRDFHRALTQVPSWHGQTEAAWPPEWAHGPVPGTLHPFHSQTKLNAAWLHGDPGHLTINWIQLQALKLPGKWTLGQRSVDATTQTTSFCLAYVPSDK